MCNLIWTTLNLTFWICNLDETPVLRVTNDLKILNSSSSNTNNENYSEPSPSNIFSSFSIYKCITK